MKFWGNDELDLDEPRLLQDISNIKSIKTNWELSFSGENYLGNFVPAFSADNIFFADSTGQIKSFNSSQGKVNWEKKVNFFIIWNLIWLWHACSCRYRW